MPSKVFLMLKAPEGRVSKHARTVLQPLRVKFLPSLLARPAERLVCRESTETGKGACHGPWMAGSRPAMTIAGFLGLGFGD
jgi:hypothetical protein